jgi:hypothetical protein
VTLPGEIEPVTTKVVPFFVTGYEGDPVEDDTLAEGTESEPPKRERPRRSAGRLSLVGQAALGAALATIVVHIVAIIVASSGSFVAGSVLAWVAIALSIAAVLAGLVAVIGRFGRSWGAAAIVVGLFANPFLLLRLLDFVGGS